MTKLILFGICMVLVLGGCVKEEISQTRLDYMINLQEDFEVHICTPIKGGYAVKFTNSTLGLYDSRVLCEQAIYDEVQSK